MSGSPHGERIIAEQRKAIDSLKNLLEERTNQYHLAHAKILSREAIIAGLQDEIEKMLRYMNQEVGTEHLPEEWRMEE